MMIISLIYCVFLVLLVIGIPHGVAASTDNENPKVKRGHLRGFSVKKRSLDARKALLNAIFSSLPSGDIDEKALDEAVNFGFGRNQVRYMSRLALKQKESEEGSIERLKKDMERLVSPDMAFPISEDEEEEVDGTVYDYNYRPKGSWHTSQETHVLVSTAILTAIRSPTSEVDPKALEDAIAAGISHDDMKEYIDAAMKN
mmetsp:Transcript_34665/g.38317  ORF Transcript_34665/g.38317 Transcript_34665/m.38317 type:complete len:200 (+) Transcript_34665:186-785(+)